jgi:hypothetical protein
MARASVLLTLVAAGIALTAAAGSGPISGCLALRGGYDNDGGGGYGGNDYGDGYGPRP